MQGIAHVLFNQEHRQTFLRHQRAHHAKHLVDHDGGQAQGRLIEHQQFGQGHHGAGDGAHLTLAPRQTPSQLATPLGQDGEQAHHLFQALGHAGTGRRVVSTEFQVFQHRHEREQTPTLGHHDQAARCRLMGGDAVKAFALKLHMATEGGQVPADGEQQSGFARAVGTQHRHDFALAHGQRHTVKYRQLPIARAQVVNFQHIAHGRSPVAVACTSVPPLPMWPSPK